MALTIEGKVLTEGPLVTPQTWEVMKFVYCCIGVKFYAEERYGAVQVWIVKEDIELANHVRISKEAIDYWNTRHEGDITEN